MTETNLTPSELNLLSHFQGPCLCSPQRLRLLKDLAVKVWRMWIFLLAPRPRSSSTTWSWSCRILCMALKRLPHICQLRVRRHEYLLVSKGDKRQILGVWGMNVLLSIYTYNCKRQLWGPVRVDTWKIVMLQDYSLKDVTKTLFYLSNKSINLQRAFWLVVQNCLLKAGLKGTALRRDGGNSLQPPHDAVSLSIEQKKFVWLINLWIVIGWVLKWAVVFFGTRKCLQDRLLNCQILQTETNSQTCVVIFSRSAAHVFH